MTIQPGAVLNTLAYGNRPEGVEVPVIADRAPSTYDWNYPLGKRWVDKTNDAAYELTSITQSGGVNTATWVTTAGGTALSTLTAGDAAVATSSAGNITFVDTTNVVSTASGSTVTFDLGINPVITDNLTVTNTITATNGDIVATAGNIEASVGSVSAGTSVTAGTLLYAAGDAAGAVGTNALSNVNSTTIGVGTGTVKMSTANNADSAAWIKIYIENVAYWIPAWTTNAP